MLGAIVRRSKPIADRGLALRETIEVAHRGPYSKSDVTGTLFCSRVFIHRQRRVDDAWENDKAGMFTSTLWVSGEILLGLSLTLFVGGMIATLGDRARMGRR